MAWAVRAGPYQEGRSNLADLAMGAWAVAARRKGAAPGAAVGMQGCCRRTWHCDARSPPRWGQAAIGTGNWALAKAYPN